MCKYPNDNDHRPEIVAFDDVELGIAPVAVKHDADNWRRHYTFAMYGKTWQIVQDHFPQQMEIILTRGAIYARMSPEQKQSLIMELPLSETESSIASPFTSRKSTIAAVPNVINEGRAALVNREQNLSTSTLKYMQLQYNKQLFGNWPPISNAYELHGASDEPPAEIQPTYVNLSAEQNLDAQPGGFPGSFDNNLATVEAQKQLPRLSTT
ncbi:hypothetical protein ACLKA6_010345 [Drosophila palustris]